MESYFRLLKMAAEGKATALEAQMLAKQTRDSIEQAISKTGKNLSKLFADDESTEKGSKCERALRRIAQASIDENDVITPRMTRHAMWKLATDTLSSEPTE